MINFMAEAMAVTVSSWLLTKKCWGIRLFSQSLLIWFILFFAQIILVEMILGIFNLLFFNYVFFAHLLILIIVLSVGSSRKIIGVWKPDLEFLVNSNLFLFVFSVFSAFFLVRTCVNLIIPSVFPDGLQVYLSFPATWIKSGNLDNPVGIFATSSILNAKYLETSSTSYYPINAQLFFTWLMLPLRNSFLANLGQAPFYIIGIVAFYSILRRYGLNRTIAFLSGFLWALIPNIFKQFRHGAQIDIICSVLLLLFFYTILLLKQDFVLKNVILFGISAGILIGSKVINILWLAAFLPFICYLLFNGIKENKFTLRKVLSFLGVIAFLIFLFGGFIYIKNYLYTGNPLFPVNLKIFGKVIFKGLLDGAEYKMKVAPWKWDIVKVLFSEGLGVQFLALILPCTILPVFFYRYLRIKIPAITEHLLLFSIPFSMLFLYVAFINIYTTRYLFPYLSLGLLTAIIFISKFPRGDKFIYFISFVSIFAAVLELAKGYELVVSILLTAGFFIALVLYKKQVIRFYKSKMFGKFVFAALLLASLLLVYLNSRFNQEEFDRYPLSFSKKEASQRDIAAGWKALNDLTGQGARVAYTGRQEFYPLFGTRIKNDVTYVSINEKEVSPYNKFDGLFRLARDFLAWRGNLKKEKIEYLFIAKPFFNNRESKDPVKFLIEDEWARAHPEDFKLLYSNSLSRIYKVLIEK
ncbi:MAG: hypothetical protein NTX01_06735 [Candidatus Omnitrophica bacterium]|nr:hypothetical protein [Candidatus Omnitrophota bacterium]